ncbi:MAG TPA: serine/threonine-protein kinase [Vicinamibacterales bacterium]|nr:serine/threonine-protein kinase [Vicinamibacterales bacterium]
MRSVYNQIGPYDIHQEIGRGGMAVVFLATDTSTGQRVALRTVPGYTAPDVLAAEHRGAELQEQFCRVSGFVPQVYKYGTESDYFYVAMEYLDGENLSQAIRRGPLNETRALAVAIELCRFLEDARGFTWTVEGREVRHLLHGDLTPANVRLTSDGRVKVLDFGIAKALSMSRKVTRNDFGSLAYLSPERIESGGEMDATDGFWALGVMLYEMLKGAPPFAAPDTRRLERVIMSRRPAPLLEGVCPTGLQGIVAKLLGPTPADRYPSAEAIRHDLERYQSGEETDAQKQGWPAKAADEPVTRRLTPPPAEEATRRTVPPPLPVLATAVSTSAPTRATVPPAAPAAPITAPTGGPRRGFPGARHGVGAAKPVVPPPLPPPPGKPVPGAGPHSGMPRAAKVPRPTSRFQRGLRWALVVLTAMTILNEISVGRSAGRVAETVPSRSLESLGPAWAQYQQLSQGGIGLGTARLRRMLTQRTMTLTDRIAATYREGLKVVWEPQWTEAREVLARAAAANPDHEGLNGALRYTEGHLFRINGDARKAKGDEEAAQREYAEAITAFREAAQLRPRWPDPFIGLSRTFIAGLGDVDRGADAMAQAQRLGYTPGQRETAQLAGGYQDRGDSLWQSARGLRGMPQERDYLSRAENAYQQALDLYAGIAAFSGVPSSVRRTQAGLQRVKGRLEDIDGSSFGIDLGPLGSVTFKKDADDSKASDKPEPEPGAEPEIEAAPDDGQ